MGTPDFSLCIAGGTPALTALPWLGGCSGSSGVTPSALPAPTTIPTIAVSGVVQNAAGTGVVGDAVVFDRGSTVYVGPTTGTGGAFTARVPITAITGNDALSILDASGGLSTTVSFTLTQGSTAPVTIPTITVGPPPPPGVV